MGQMPSLVDTSQDEEKTREGLRLDGMGRRDEKQKSAACARHCAMEIRRRVHRDLGKARRCRNKDMDGRGWVGQSSHATDRCDSLHKSVGRGDP